MGQDDRRKYSRRSKQSIISFYVIEENGNKHTHEGVVVDGSTGGVRFRAKRSLKKNTRLYIKLQSEDWGDELTYHIKKNDLGLIELIGSVMWCLETQDSPGEFEVGTRFLGEPEQ